MQLFWVNEDFFTACGMQDEATWLQYAFPNFSNVVIEWVWLFYRIYLIMTPFISIFCLFSHVSYILLELTMPTGVWAWGILHASMRLVQFCLSRL